MDAVVYRKPPPPGNGARISPAEWLLRHHSRVLVRVVPDAIWPGMYRLHWPNGRRSDLANLTRIKDAAEAIAERGPPLRHRRDFVWKQGGQVIRTSPARLFVDQVATDRPRGDFNKLGGAP